MNTQHNVSGEWTTGLCGCCEDPGSCVKTSCCPCITFGQNAVIVDRNNTSCFGSGLVFCMLANIGISCLYSYPYRSKLREQYKLPEKPCGDCILHWCCTPCVLCQEYRELKNRGLNPSKGWEAASAMAPPEIAIGMPRA
ncbi:Protein PLANT CADMIUM RESISTANCE 12 [Linum perenne]